MGRGADGGEVGDAREAGGQGGWREGAAERSAPEEGEAADARPRCADDELVGAYLARHGKVEREGEGADEACKITKLGISGPCLSRTIIENLV